MGMSKKTKVAVIIASAVVAAGAITWIALGASGKNDIVLETAPVSRIKIENSVTATGTVEPVTLVDVGTQVSGIIAKLYADYNDVVKQGQLIAEMDKVTLEADLRLSQAELESSKSEYEYQSKNYERTKILYDKELVSDQEYDDALYLYQQAKSAYERCKADIVKVERNLGYATITSPIDGVVISRAVEEGQTVAAGFETPTLFTIANDLTQMQVVADVDEADIGNVKEGQRVQFTVDAYPDDVFDGLVEQVRLEATTESSVVTYEVVISAYNPELKLKPGLTANVTIFTIEKDNVMAIPSKALRFIPDKELLSDMDIAMENSGFAAGGIAFPEHHDPAAGIRAEDKMVQAGNSVSGDTAGMGGREVWIKSGDSVYPAYVVTGSSSGEMIEVVSGLAGDETVVTGLSVKNRKEKKSMERNPFMPGPPGRK